MWVRRIGRVGNSEMVHFPVSALRALEWKRGDFLVIEMPNSHQLLMTKFDPAQVPDRVREALVPLPEIQHG